MKHEVLAGSSSPLDRRFAALFSLRRYAKDAEPMQRGS
jgi:hypothetical protein